VRGNRVPVILRNEKWNPVKLKKGNVYGFLIIHMIAGLAILPWFFSWTGVVLFVAGLYVFGVFGINLCFHRLLTHRSFSIPLWLEHALATFAAALDRRPSPPS
jgi:fatty-acid desaturase